MKPIVNILFASDDTFSSYLSVSIQSIIDNSSAKNHYNIFVFDNHISDKNKDLIKTMNTSNVEIIFIDAADLISKCYHFISDARISVTTYLRLFAARILNIDKVLYLDCDLIVLDDIAHLYQIDLGENVVGAVLDNGIYDWFTKPSYCEHMENLGMKNFKNYFNAGVLLMNLQKIREENLEEKFLKTAQKNTHCLMDQNVLNAVLENRVLYLNNRFNYQVCKDIYQYEEISDTDILNKVTIIHYCGKDKPLNTSTYHDAFFWKYALRTPEKLFYAQKNRHHQIETVKISSTTKELFSQLSNQYNEYSEMTLSEQQFLAELLLQKKPQKALEIGVAGGSSSVILLKALSTLPNKQLISADYLTYFYKDPDKKVGFIVDEYPELKKNWQLFSGGLISDFIEEIKEGIDFCFIDTAHRSPGELLDFILIFPFLKENALVVIHDTNLHTWDNSPLCTVNNMLISALSGKKLHQDSFEKTFYHQTEKKEMTTPFSNISAVILDNSQADRLWDIFNLLTQKWHYIPTEKDTISIITLLRKYYHDSYAKLFEDILNYQIERFQKNQNKLPTPPLEIEPSTQEIKENVFLIDEIKNFDEHIQIVMKYQSVKWKYFKYKLLSKIPFLPHKKKIKKRYKEIKNTYKKWKNIIRKIN